MTDIALGFDPAAYSADIALLDGDLATDDGLMTAIIISFFTDARARPDDILPQAGADRRGWWGDAFNDNPDDSIGSRAWLLEREKLTPATALKYRDIYAEAADWLVQDGVVRELIIATEIVRPTALRVTVTFSRPEGPARQRFDFVWDATERSLAA